MDQFSAHLDRGWDLVTRGDFHGALCSAQEGMEIDGDSPEVHNLMGYIFAQQGEIERALEHYDQAISADETYLEALLNAAELLIHPLGRLDDALLRLEEALSFCETTDEIADAILLKLDIHLRRGAMSAAREVLGELPEGPFENPELKFRIGRAYFDVGDTDAAQALLEETATQSPAHPEALYYSALTLEAKGERRLATVRFLQVRDIDLQRPPAPWAIPTDHFENRVKAAMRRLSPVLKPHLDDALVIVNELPGVEVVAHGVDPRAPMLFDDIKNLDSTPVVGQLFVYQRNIERTVTDITDIEDAILRHLEEELSAAVQEARMHYRNEASKKDSAPED